MEYPELRIGFHTQDDRHYEVELHCTIPGAADEVAAGPYLIEIDWDKLRREPFVLTDLDSVDAYGQTLSELFFSNSNLRAAFASACGQAAAYHALRVRLCFTVATQRLHNVAWERLQDPQTQTRLATDQHILISRFLSGSEMRAVRLRAKSALRALVVIANPTGLDLEQVDGRALRSIDVDAEWQRVAESLKPIGIERLTGPKEAVSLDNVVAKLREGFDILYLVCHGALIDEQPMLWLEKAEGGIDHVAGERLAVRLKEMREPPRLIVLASCQSAGRGNTTSSEDGGALAALAPKLAEAGVPAVIAMQGDIRMVTASVFFPTFFKELMQDGQIDRAVAVARSAIRDRADWWVPVLITRLQLGRIWFEHGGDEHNLLDHEWAGVVDDVGSNGCTPIIGPDLSATLLGSQMELARIWAERYEFPMFRQERESLPQVAQYLAFHPKRSVLERELESYAWRFLVHNFPNKVPPGVSDQRDKKKDPPLAQLLTHIWREQLRDNPKDAYWLLAGMPFPVFITTNRDNLLIDALKERGKSPRCEICRWPVFDEAFGDGWPPSVFTQEPDYSPNVQNPIVFHAFGHMSYPRTLVLTEDDYFDYLIGITRRALSTHTGRKRETGTAAFPEVVKTAFSRRGLLFLGFRISDWQFRTLFRRILAQEGSQLTGPEDPRHVSVSVQLGPTEGGEYMEPEGARQYLSKYFQPKRVQIFWGTAEQFIQQLYSKWTNAGSPEPSESELKQ